MSESIELLLKNAQILLNLGNPKEALVLYEKVLFQEPTHKEALLKKGHVLGKLGKYENTIDCYDAVIQQDSGNLLAYLNKGLAHHYVGECDVAIRCFDMVLDSKPNNTTALYNKASSLVKSGRFDEGLGLLSDVIQLDASFKEKAKFDVDFQHIKKLTEFKKITV
ncbi:hypothetical protein NsoK4_04770 [Nitrosopumilus sp. K4]|uniref:tetratricopeptide repeat protein n=1 Tax=Nitrosopumilus sp. K4 TaxID=2795383 RepID=UPI001BA9424E|nr:tetratricopeptide repeat protein [Nitrosopumilus sp. K4]QUC65552.1 hypothetical protein NsoK4_04770 [Nitrosopumilus sp. K4]